MMTNWLWRVVESRLRRALPSDRVGPALADLAEDHAVRRRQTGVLRAGAWLDRESRSLAAAYRKRDRQSWLSSTWQDGRGALRDLRRRPLSTVGSVGMLALAISITTTMFTMVDALILRPVPFRASDELAILRLGPNSPWSSPATFRAWRNSRAFAGVEGVKRASSVIATDAGDVPSKSARVTPGIFDLLGGVTPERGRLFHPSDAVAGGGEAALISGDLWSTLYASDPGIIGRQITIDKSPAVVVGVLPSKFRFPDWNTSIWRAADFEAPETAGPVNRPEVYVRFGAGVPRADALQRAVAVANETEPANKNRTVITKPLTSEYVDASYSRAAPLLSGGVALLFVVLVANVCSLRIAGLMGRTRELRTRTALGASRSRLMRQAALEGAVLGVLGIVGGLAVGWVLLSMARVWLLDAISLHSLNVPTIDARSFVVTAMAGLAASLAVGVLPGMIGTRVDAGRSSEWSDRGGTETKQARAASRALLVCQIALSCTLLIGAALLVRSFVKLTEADRGFDPGKVVVVSIDMPPAYRNDSAWREHAAAEFRAKALAIPGVSHAAWSYGTPPGGAVTREGEWRSDVPGTPPITMMAYDFRVDPDFFAVYDIPILRGRSLLPSDVPRSVVVGERFAHALWPGLDPIGRTFAFENFPFEVVGLVKEIRFPSLDRARDAPQFYQRLDGVLTMGMLGLRCDAAVRCPDAASVQRQLAGAYAGVSVSSVRPLELVYLREFARPRAAAGLALAFAVTALLASAAGLFSLLSHTVARRRREFGIRSALGATPSHVRGLVRRDGLAVTLLGVGIGVAGGLLLARALKSLLFDVTAADPVSLVIVGAVLASTVLAASWHPARTAARTDPLILLRDE
jgi:putative ABC transport system permease protein